MKLSPQRTSGAPVHGGDMTASTPTVPRMGRSADPYHPRESRVAAPPSGPAVAKPPPWVNGAERPHSANTQAGTIALTSQHALRATRHEGSHPYVTIATRKELISVEPTGQRTALQMRMEEAAHMGAHHPAPDRPQAEPKAAAFETSVEIYSPALAEKAEHDVRIEALRLRNEATEVTTEVLTARTEARTTVALSDTLCTRPTRPLKPSALINR